MELFATLDLVQAGALLAGFILFFLVAKSLKSLFTPYDMSHELTENNNPAVALSLSGYLLATTIIYAACVVGPSKATLMDDLIAVAGYSGIGLGLLALSQILIDKFLLRKFSNHNEISGNQNIAVGAVSFGGYVATGLVAAGALVGEGGGILSTAVYFALGQVCLLVFSFIYDKITPYSLHEELEKGNKSAGIAFAGTLIALGIIVMSNANGDMTNWATDLTEFGITAGIAFIALPIIRILMDKLLLPGVDLSDEIVKDRSDAAGWLEAISAISFAVMLSILL